MPVIYGIVCATKKGGADMSQISVKELYYGDKYNVMGEVFKQMLLSHDRSIDEQTRLELEIVRQTIIATEKMKRNGDSISDIPEVESLFLCKEGE